MRLALALVPCLALVGRAAAGVTFPAPPENEALPRGAALAVAPDGSLRVNGQPRYLTATVFYGNVAAELKTHTSGYPAALNWLYEAVPDFDGFQRLGVDALGFEAGRTWMRDFSSKPNFWQADPGLPADPSFAGILAGQLPAYVDFTPAPWGHGGLAPADAPQLPKEAWTVGQHHWVPYSIHHPEGRRLWLSMWRKEAERLQALAVRPWCYELMNEPTVLDTGAYARARFAETGRADNPIEFLKYTDERFADLIAEGVKTVRAVQPDARVTLQPCTMRGKGIDLYALSRVLDVICAPTGGGGLVGAHLMRTLADGKPLVDGETYLGTTARSVRNALVTQFARGFNASYTFKWSRRPRDWARGGDAAAEAPLARKVPVYNLLNPYVFPTEALHGFRLARREMLAVGDLFVPRDRGTPRRVAVLFSRPTERTMHGNPNKVAPLVFEKVVEQLDYAHLNPDVIFEEQLRDEQQRLDRYRMLVVPGVDAVLPTTPAAVRAWQARGGRLMLVGGRMDADEYGRPTGETYPGADFIAARGVRADEIGARLVRIAAQAGVVPGCSVVDDETGGDVPRIEVTDAARDGRRGWIVTSRAQAPQLVRFRPSACGEMMVLVSAEVRAGCRVVTTCRELVADASGAFPLCLVPGEAQILVSGSRADLTARLAASADCVWGDRVTPEAARAAGRKALAAAAAAKHARKGGYHPDRLRTQPLNLRPVANAKALTDRDWGLREVEGVPFEFIRTDQNNFKDVLRLASGTTPVRVEADEDVLHLYLNYAGSPDCRLEYADGSAAAVVPVPAAGEGRRVFRATNPQPGRRVAALTFASREGTCEIVAVTVERPVPGTVSLFPEAVKSVRSRSGARIEPVFADGELRLVHGAEPASWSCAALQLKEPIALPASKVRLAMEVNALPNRFGSWGEVPGFQISAGLVVGGKTKHTGYRVPVTDDGLAKFARADGDSNSWETVSLTLDEKDAKLDTVTFQYQRVSTDPGALAVRNLRLEPLGPAKAAAYPSGCPDFTIDLPQAKKGPVVRAADYGLSPTNRFNGAAIQRAAAAAKACGAVRLELAPGRYLCHDATGIALEGFEDFTFDGKGAELVFYRPPAVRTEGGSDAEGFSSSFLLKDCTRLKFGNLSVDWDWDVYPLASFATVVGGHVDERDNASYVDFEFVDYARHPFYPNLVPVQTVMAILPTRDGFSAEFGGCYFGMSEGHTGAKSEWLSPNRLRLWPSVKPDDPKATVLESGLRHYVAKSNRGQAKALRSAAGTGKLFRLAHAYYGKGAFRMDSCAHLTMKDIHIRSAFGMGFVTAGSQHHWQIVDCDVKPPPGVKRPITVTADANHVVNSRGWARIENFTATMNQDDLSNFHDCISAAKRVAPKTLAFTHARGNAYFKAKPGDEIELRQFNYEATGLFAKVVTATDGRLVLDRDVPAAKYESYMLFNRSFSTDHLLLRNCTFANCTGRCCFMGNDVTVENCTFRGLLTTPLKFQAAFMLTAWAEGHGCTNVVVRGCTFEDCQRKLQPAYGDTVAETFVGRNLRISYEKGGFDLPVAYGIVSDILFENNRWIRPRAPIVQVFCAEKVTFRDNTVELGEIRDGKCLPDRGKVVVERSRDVDLGGLNLRH